MIRSEQTHDIKHKVSNIIIIIINRRSTYRGTFLTVFIPLLGRYVGEF